MDFVIPWLCYLAAFVTGSAVAWVLVTVSMTSRAKPDSPAEPAPSEPEPQVFGSPEIDAP